MSMDAGFSSMTAAASASGDYETPGTSTARP